MNPQVWTFRTIDEDAFIERFGPKPNHLDPDASFGFGAGGCLFASGGPEYEHVRAQNPLTVWTVIEGDQGLAIESGFHRVNNLGFILTIRPIEDRATYTVMLD